jgi:hypothetical protein
MTEATVRKTILLAAALALGVAPLTALAQSQTPPNNNVDPTPSQAGSHGPLNTTSGGSPASSPQGEAPPGMQAAPKGNSQTFGTQTEGAKTGEENGKNKK